MAPSGPKSTYAFAGKGEGRKWSCSKCGGWSWCDLATCFKCNAPRGKKQYGGGGGGVPGDKAPTTVTVGDFILLGEGKKGRKNAKVLERRLARLVELEAKEAGVGKGALAAGDQGSKASEDDSSKDDAVAVEVLEEKAACFKKWGDLEAAAAAEKELEARRRKPKASSPEACDRNVKRLQKLLADKGAHIEKMEESLGKAKQACTKLAEELAVAELAQKRVAKEYSQKIVGLEEDGVPTIQLAKLLSKKEKAFRIDTGELFVTKGTEIEISPEEEAEIEKRRSGLEEGLEQLAVQFFATICDNIQAAKDVEAAEEVKRRASKKRRTGSGDAQQPLHEGDDGGEDSSATLQAGQAAFASSQGAGQEAAVMDGAAGNAGSRDGGTKPSYAEGALEEARRRAGTAALQAK